MVSRRAGPPRGRAAAAVGRPRRRAICARQAAGNKESAGLALPTEPPQALAKALHDGPPLRHHVALVGGLPAPGKRRVASSPSPPKQSAVLGLLSSRLIGPILGAQSAAGGLCSRRLVGGSLGGLRQLLVGHALLASAPVLQTRRQLRTNGAAAALGLAGG